MKRYDRLDSYLSVPAGSWLLAMRVHAEYLLERRPSGHPAPIVNGHASALSLMAVLVLDALANRAAYMIRELGGLAPRVGTQPLASHPRSTATFIVKLLEDRKPVAPSPAAIREVYVLRNVLAHGYLWSVDVGERDEPATFDVLRTELVDGFGDPAFKDAVEGAVTRTLRLNLVPTVVGVRDAGVVLSVVWEAVSFLATVKGAAISLAAMSDFRAGNGRGLLTLGELGQRLLELSAPARE